jgi:hypothetical protein
MPNHCSNRVSFYSEDTTAILKLYNIFENGTNPKTKETVFGSFIPEPDWKNIPLTENTLKQYSFSSAKGEVGELPVESGDLGKGLHFASTGIQDDRWYDWRNQNWGTKWDCYDLTIDEDEMPYGFTAEFNTAWCPPEEVASAIKEQFDDLSMSWFYDEPGCEIAGYL